MLSLSSDATTLVLSVERSGYRFGDGTRVLLTIDLERRVLQRGRHETIPLSTVDGFGVDPDSGILFCRLGAVDMPLFESREEDSADLERAARELAEFCGARLF